MSWLHRSLPHHCTHSPTLTLRSADWTHLHAITLITLPKQYKDLFTS